MLDNVGNRYVYRSNSYQEMYDKTWLQGGYPGQVWLRWTAEQQFMPKPNTENEFHTEHH